MAISNLRLPDADFAMLTGQCIYLTHHRYWITKKTCRNIQQALSMRSCGYWIPFWMNASMIYQSPMHAGGTSRMLDWIWMLCDSAIIHMCLSQQLVMQLAEGGLKELSGKS